MDPLHVWLNKCKVLVVTLQATGVCRSAVVCDAHNLDFIVLAHEQGSTRVTDTNTLWGVLCAKLSITQERWIVGQAHSLILDDQSNLTKDFRFSAIVIDIYKKPQ